MVLNVMCYNFETRCTSAGSVRHGWCGYDGNKKAQLWLRNPRDATAFQIHPEEIHRNYYYIKLLRLHTAWNSVFSKWVSYSNYKYV